MVEKESQYKKIEREVFMLTFGSSDLNENVKKIADETIKLFGNDSDVIKRVNRFKELPKKKRIGEFQITKQRFINDLIYLFSILSANSFGDLIGKIKRIELKEKTSKKIFIVHGHNEQMKSSVSDFIKSIGLEPIILHEQPNHGSKTIIEKFEKNANVGFAIVLLSGDDLGYQKSDSHTNAKYRARQNVIFELGFFIGKIGRENVIGLYDYNNEFEFPSDYDGVLYVPYDEKEEWKKAIITELTECGYKI